MESACSANMQFFWVKVRNPNFLFEKDIMYIFKPFLAAVKDIFLAAEKFEILKILTICKISTYLRAVYVWLLVKNHAMFTFLQEVDLSNIENIKYQKY